ncbi:MAG: ATP-binding cassette domain-containing protein, partial [Halomonas sp.]
ATWGFSQSYQQVVDQQLLRRLTVDQVQACAELISYQSSQWHRSLIARQEQQALSNQRSLGRRTALINCLVGAVSGLMVIGVLWLASVAFHQQWVTGPILVMAVLIALGANEAFIALPASFMKLGASYAAVRRLNKLTAGREPMGSPVTLPVGVGFAITAYQLSLTYAQSFVPALSDISFELPAGKRAVITGSSGAGKSSLASLLMGRLRATQGDIMIAGVHAWHLSPASRASKLAML